MAHPVIPEATAKIWAQLGLGDIQKLSLKDLKWGQLQLGTKLGKVEAVFPRADKSAIERMQKMEEQGRSSGSRDRGATGTKGDSDSSGGYTGSGGAGNLGWKDHD